MLRVLKAFVLFQGKWEEGTKKQSKVKKKRQIKIFGHRQYLSFSNADWNITEENKQTNKKTKTGKLFLFLFDEINF